MNWQTITSDLGQKTYALWGNGHKLLTLAINSSSSFAKVESEKEKRSFTIRYEGFLKNKLVMRNEYGVKIAYVTTDNKDNLIAFKDERLFYSILDDNKPRIIIYKDSIDRPLAECDLLLENDKGILSPDKPVATRQSLLLALCWYLFSPVTQEKLEYA